MDVIDQQIVNLYIVRRLPQMDTAAEIGVDRKTISCRTFTTPPAVWHKAARPEHYAPGGLFYIQIIFFQSKVALLACFAAYTHRSICESVHSG